MNKIFTIGHSIDSLDSFIYLLESNKINTLVDIRSIPYSSFANQFNKERLSAFIKKNKLNYISMGELLGARYENKELLFEDGKVNFSKVINTQQFQEGIERIENGIKKGYQIALMCSEKNPLQCHRFSLISHFLDQQGYIVNHIIDKNLFSHKLLENNLLCYYHNRRKLSFDINKINQPHPIQHTLFNNDKPDQTNLYFRLNRLVAYNSNAKQMEAAI
ncbi:MAG: DUF488 domain-containing protein [Deltaproteobacteria bacterium]|nr:DUF488 domain-containing protein [Deltaproteobacteria bacterium]